jgi:hypothetical protein
VQPLQVRVGAQLRPFQVKPQRPAEERVEFEDCINRQQVVLARRRHAFGADVIEQHREIPQHRPGVFRVDGLLAQELFLVLGELALFHGRRPHGADGAMPTGFYIRESV